MTNIINNLLSSEKTTNTNTASSTSEQTVKDKPSLFDSLLYGAWIIAICWLSFKTNGTNLFMSSIL